MIPHHEFWQAYERLSREGRCDNAGGAEYRRLFADWNSHGCPSSLDEFITSRVNTAADSEGPELYQSSP
jgi:hypothetical protein